MRKALLVGIENYDKLGDLPGCNADVERVYGALSRHADRDADPNYRSERLTSAHGIPRITESILQQKIEALFHAVNGDVLFYFSGHGSPTQTSGYLVASDASPGDRGVRMNEVIELANRSSANSVLIILDCCYAALMGAVPAGGASAPNLREGVTVLAGSGPAQVSLLTSSGSIFTNLVVAALNGGAADILGNVTASSIYAYVEASLGAWDQRPYFKTNSGTFFSVRRCKPKIPKSRLRRLTEYFVTEDASYQLDPDHEEYEPSKRTPDQRKEDMLFEEGDPQKIEIRKELKALQLAGIVEVGGNVELFWACINSGTVHLTPLGKFYWRLAKNELI